MKFSPTFLLEMKIVLALFFYVFYLYQINFCTYCSLHNSGPLSFTGYSSTIIEIIIYFLIKVVGTSVKNQRKKKGSETKKIEKIKIKNLIFDDRQK